MPITAAVRGIGLGGGRPQNPSFFWAQVVEIVQRVATVGIDGECAVNLGRSVLGFAVATYMRNDHLFTLGWWDEVVQGSMPSIEKFVSILFMVRLKT